MEEQLEKVMERILLKIKLDRTLAEPLYLQLRNGIRSYLLSSEGERCLKLPTELEFCRALNVSRNTVSQALALLADEHLVSRIKHRGTIPCSALDHFDDQNFERTIGVVFPKSGAWEEAIGAIGATAEFYGYHWRLYRYDWEDVAMETKMIRKAFGDSVGIIVYPSSCDRSHATVSELNSQGYPVVFFDLYAEHLECSSVAVDHFLGAYRLGGQLLQNCCRRPGLIEWENRAMSVDLRRNGFLRALDDHKISFDPSWTFRCKPETKVEEMIEWQEKNRIDSLFIASWSEELTALVQKCALRMNGANALPIYAFDLLFSPMHGVIARLDQTALGRSAVLLLKDSFQNADSPRKKVLIAPTIEKIE